MDIQSRSKINYMFMPSLQRLALVKIASLLWNQRDVRDLLSEKLSYDNGVSEADWQVIEDKVIEKVPKLLIARKLEKFLIYYIHPVGFQILDWINFHVIQCRYVPITMLPSDFFWTPQGNMDKSKVAETLVNDERLDICIRFKLACIYCLEEYIKLLWQKLPNSFYKEQPLETIVTFWSYYVAGKMDQMYDDFAWGPLRDRNITHTLLASKVSVNTGNEAGTRYFLPKLTPQDREHVLLINASCVCLCEYRTETCFSDYSYSNNLCYLLSEMDEVVQRKLFSVYAPKILQFLLNWPWQKLFWKTAKENWCFITQEGYYSLLEAVGEKIFSKAKDFNYQKLFGKFWLRGSDGFKRHAIINGGLKLLLPGLFAVGDTENITLIFKAATVQEKEEFIFCAEGLLVCYDLIEIENWNLLKLFILECTSSKEVFHELKKKIEFSCDIRMEDEVDMLNEFYHFLYDIEQEITRKYIDDKFNSLATKLCSSS